MTTTAASTFGHWAAPFTASALLLAFRVLGDVGTRLDALHFRKHPPPPVRRPVLIASPPRTGSTFLHRFLIQTGVGVGLPLWRMLVPSAVLQRWLYPVLHHLERLFPVPERAAAIHEMGLHLPETDEAALYFRYLDGFFLYAFYLAFADEDFQEAVAERLAATTGRDARWLGLVWRAGLAAQHSDRVVARLFSAGARLPALLAHLPDARVLYVLRDPRSIIPSTMSLVTSVLEARFGFWQLPSDRRARYLGRLYRALVALLRGFHDDWVGGRIDRDRVQLVRYDRMIADFDAVMEEVLSFIDVPITPVGQAQIAAQAERQRAYRSPHSYTPALFGLTRQQIARDCAFFYETFGTVDT